MILRLTPTSWLAAPLLLTWLVVGAEHSQAQTPSSEVKPAAIVAGDEQPKNDSPAATPEQVAGWIAELDDNRYLTREQASRQLLVAGAMALDPLMAAANGDRPEPADRAVWVLQRLGESPERELRRQALERLVQVQKQPKVQSAARRALADLRNDEAIDALRSLGAQFIASPFADNANQNLVVGVILETQWRGGDAGLRHLRDLLGLRQVFIIGTDISPEAMSELQHIDMLETLCIYNTRMERGQLPELQRQLPRATIDFRRGGLLGIKADNSGGNTTAVVGFVQKESAAEAAGIKVGDAIVKIENQPVTNFQDLTSKIGEHLPGDEVTLEILRGGKPLTLKAKLGQWTADNLPGRMTPP